MKVVLFYIKFILKGGYINSFKKLKFTRSSWIGKSVSIFFENDGTAKQRIVLGEGVRIGNFSDLTVGVDHAIVLKDLTTLNTHCKLIGDVTIERYCLLSANIFISSGQHYATRYPHLLIRQQDEKVLSTEAGRQQHSKPVHIEEDVWIGFGVFIKQGITIGRGAVIGANAVVLNDVRPYEIVGGNPAKKIKDRLEFNPPASISAQREEDRPYFYRGFDHYHGSADKPPVSTGMRAYEESTVAIQTIRSETVQCQGFSVSPHPIPIRVLIDGYDAGMHTVEGKTFELNLRCTDPAFATRGINPFSFITFAVPYEMRLSFGMNTIKLVQVL